MASVFDAAVEHIKRSDQSVSNSDKLKFYGLYKQASSGDCKGNEPSRFSAVAHAKWTAWNKLKGMSAESARSEYIKFVSSVYSDFTAPSGGSKGKVQEPSLVATTATLRSHTGKTHAFDSTSEMLATLKKKQQHGKDIAFTAILCLGASGVGIAGFLLTTLSTQALMCLGLVFAGLGGAVLSLVQLHQVYGILPLYAPWLQRVLLERTMIETILDGTIVKQWMDWFAEIGPVFQCKTDEDRVAALQNMSEKTRRWITTRGVVNLLPEWQQKITLSAEQYEMQKRRLADDNIAYFPPLNRGLNGTTVQNAPTPNLDMQRKLTKALWKKSIFDTLSNFIVGNVNAQLCGGASIALSLSFLLQLRSSEYARKAVIQFFKGSALRATSIGAILCALLAVLRHLALQYKIYRRKQGLIDPPN